MRESPATVPPTQTAARASTINQYQAFNGGEYEMAKHPSAPPLYSKTYGDRPTSTTLIDNALYDEHKPPVTSPNAAETDNDLTVIDNDLYEHYDEGQGHRITSADYDCTLIDNDLYR